MEQITNRIVMVRPANFGFNEETAKNNKFQEEIEGLSSKMIAGRAVEEFDAMVELLRDNDIEVEVIQDTTDPIKPDAVFPNNWFTTHEDGTLITYPIYAPIRRKERREDIVDKLLAETKNPRRYGFEYFEESDKFLEGTGSMILDRQNKIVYACLSPRTHVEVLEKFAVLRNYRKVFFHSVDRNGVDIYHTNVIMAMGEDFVTICMDTIEDEQERSMLLDIFRETGKEIIDISHDQMASFAGNMIQLKNKFGNRFIVMSQQAKFSLNNTQLEQLSGHGTILDPFITTIETIGGGSARCMIAENFLPVE